MSEHALVNAVASFLQSASGMSYAATTCRVMPDGMPIPMAGELFVSVWSAGYRNQDDIGQSLDEVYGVNVTLSRRAGFAPADRAGTDLIAVATNGLMKETEAIRAKMHMDPNAYAIIHAANVIITAAANGFVEPLRFQSAGLIERKGPEWFDGYAEHPSEAPAGFAQTLFFGGARRVQTIESQS